MIDYNEIAVDYDDRYQSEMSKREDYAISQILSEYLYYGDNVLDIGCGTGHIHDLMYFPLYTGIDTSQNMIDIAKAKHPTFNFRCTSLQEFIKEQEKFNSVICLFSIPYVGTDLANYVYQLLEDDGICICVYYDKPYLNADSVYAGKQEEFNADIKPLVEKTICGFKIRFEIIAEHPLTYDSTYTVAVFRKV